MVITAAIVETTMFAAAIGDRLTAGRRSAYCAAAIGRGQGFFLERGIKRPLRKQRTRIFSWRLLNMPLKKKHFPLWLGSGWSRDVQRPFIMIKAPAEALFLVSFFARCLIAPPGEQFSVRSVRRTRKIKAKRKKPCPLRLFCLTSPVSALLRSARADVIMTLEVRRPGTRPGTGPGPGSEPRPALQSLTRERNDGKKRDGK